MSEAIEKQNINWDIVLDQMRQGQQAIADLLQSDISAQDWWEVVGTKTQAQLNIVQPYLLVQRELAEDVPVRRQAEMMFRQAMNALAEIDRRLPSQPPVKFSEAQEESVFESAYSGPVYSEAVAGLLKMLRHQDREVRWAATLALVRIGDEEVVTALLETVQKDSEVLVRRNAAEALIAIGNTQAVQGLLEILQNTSDNYVQLTVADALAKIASNEAISSLLGILAGDATEGELRLLVADILGKIANPQVSVGLMQVLKTSQNSDVKASVAEALGKIGDATALPELEQLASLDQSETSWGGKVSFFAEEALRNIKEKQAGENE